MLSAGTKNKFLIFFFFLLWPFGALIYSLIHFRDNFNKNILWLFAAFYGFTIVIFTKEMDAYRYVQEFRSVVESGVHLKDVLSSMYKESSSLDIYKPLLMVIISSFTDDYRIFYAFVGLIFGYFYSRSLWFVLERIKVRISILLLFTILVFAFINPLLSIQFIRNGTAMVIFVYGAFLYLVDKKKAGLIISTLSILVHFSYLLPVGLLLLFHFMPKKVNYFFIFFVITTFLLEVDLPTLSEFMKNNLPAIFQTKVEGYTNLDYANLVNTTYEETNWYIRYSASTFNYLCYAFIILMYFDWKRIWKGEKEMLNLFCYVLFLYGSANLINVMPSGFRYIVPAQLLLFGLIIWIYAKGVDSIFWRILKISSIPILILYFIVEVRVSFDTMGLMVFLGNPVLAYFIHDNKPLIDIIKQIVL